MSIAYVVNFVIVMFILGTCLIAFDVSFIISEHMSIACDVV